MHCDPAKRRFPCWLPAVVVLVVPMLSSCQRQAEEPDLAMVTVTPWANFPVHESLTLDIVSWGVVDGRVVARMALHNTSPTQEVVVLEDYLPWVDAYLHRLEATEEGSGGYLAQRSGYLIASWLPPPLPPATVRIKPGERIEGAAGIGHWLSVRAEKLVRESESEVTLEGISVEGVVIVATMCEESGEIQRKTHYRVASSRHRRVAE